MGLGEKTCEYNRETEERVLELLLSYFSLELQEMIRIQGK